MQRFILIFLCLSLTACSSFRPVMINPDSNESITDNNSIRVGFNVKVFTKDGELHKFKITEITETELKGKDISIPIDSIARIEKRQFEMDSKQTIIGLALIIGLIALLANSVTFPAPGPG